MSHHPYSRRAVLASMGSLAAYTTALPSSCWASNRFPDRPVKVVVPFPPGPTDTVARIATERLPGLWKQPVIVENKAGAGGQIGGNVVAKAPADGYTLLFSTIHFAVAPSLYPKLPYDIQGDFVPICLAAEYPTVICVNVSLRVRTVADLIAYAKDNPGKLSYGSSGNGGGTHLAGELFNYMAGVSLQHVPYRGSGPAMTDLIGGQVQVMFADSPTAIPQLQGGTVRAIAVGSASRSALLPQLPTVAEAGLPGFVADTWAGVSAPAATPREVQIELNQAFRKVLSEPEIVQKLAKIGAEAKPGTQEAFGRKMRSEIEKWADVVRRADIKAN